ncbi:MAG TPA: excinuclease ABC subunit UvrC, partial [Bacteroidales bacterium]|nr:excinuclease ABC subunit UvrC [Bacteroidales bacterium]
VFSTRNPTRDGSEYFGPYASVKVMTTLLELVRQIYPLRTCNLKLNRRSIEKKHFKVCLNYHIGNCRGPCEGFQSEEEYEQSIVAVRNIIRGHLQSVKNQLTGLMQQYAMKMEFEKAQIIKEKIALLERYRSKSTIVHPSISNVDVFSVLNEGNTVYVNIIKVVDGAVIQSHTIAVHKRLDEADEDILSSAIIELRQRYNSDAPEIIVPFRPDMAIPGIKYTIPRRGDKKELLALSERNLKNYCMEQQRRQELVDPDRNANRIMQQIQEDLRLSQKPERIECFDNSNIQGSYAVASVVVFIKTRPEKKEYRHFNIRTVDGPDDYSSMKEIVGRRYSRQIKEGLQLPQLIVIDGGKGQLNAAYHELVSLGIAENVDVIGIAKRLEEIYVPGDPVPLFLDKNSVTLRLLRHVRDEAHRFAISHHRKKREKGTIKTGLTDIKGIGPAIAKRLLQHFGSMAAIKRASAEQIKLIAGNVKGQQLYDHLHHA